MLSAESETRICRHCLVTKRLTEFRRRRKSDPRRQNTCRDCHAAIERSRRHFHRERRGEWRIQQFVLALNDHAQDARRIGLLVRSAMEAVGGLERFVEMWVRHFHAVNRRRGQKRAMDFYRAVSTLIVAANELTPEKNLDALGDEELESERDWLLEELLRVDPETARAACEAHGFRVIPNSQAGDVS